MRTIAEVIKNLPSPNSKRLEAPDFKLTPNKNKTAFAIEAMKRHMTDEGWQVMQGLEQNGYTLAGKNVTVNTLDAAEILYKTHPGTVVVQDKREWDADNSFVTLGALKCRDDIFTLTILKDAHQRPAYHRQSAEEIGCNAWIIYYHPKIVNHLAQYTRPEHLIRTYHSLDPEIIPRFNPEKRGAVISGATFHKVYPLRCTILNNRQALPQLMHLPHPGYHRNGCQTKKYLKILNQYKVAICTSSIYGYALHKIIEATACGCRVLTDLPTDDILPEIDDNLIRISSDTKIPHLRKLLTHLYNTYDPELQQERAKKALAFFNYNNVCNRLANDIETLKQTY